MVRNDPCQPIASPRTAAGTIRLAWSIVAVMVGAQSRPATKPEQRRGPTPSAASAIGKVAERRGPPSSQNAEIDRCIAP